MMKKIAILLIFVFATASLTSCKSQKNGCGLTGSVDTLNLIENVSTFETSIA